MFTSTVGHNGVPMQTAPTQACKVGDRSLGRFDTLPVDTELPPSQVCRDRCRRCWHPDTWHRSDRREALAPHTR